MNKPITLIISDEYRDTVEIEGYKQSLGSMITSIRYSTH